jgi:glyoxylase-like metal-dependent hydrolase (beta-lactamase superfamily II)
MQRERITDDIYLFTSERYAQVTAAAILTGEGAVVIGTLVYPSETQAMKSFLEERLNVRVTHVINTHYHADHTTGTCFFDDAVVIAHERCRSLLDTLGRDSLESARGSSPEMDGIDLVLPGLTFSDRLTLHLGRKTFHLRHTPGHTPDSIICWLEQDNVLLAADTVMPVPYFIDGDYADLLESLRSLQARDYEAIVQGYGEMVLRGEVRTKLQTDIDYLVKLDQAVDDALASDTPATALDAIQIEDCGISRVLLNGMVEKLHRQNVTWLAERRGQPQPQRK